jgi:hypothetical protein
MHKAWRRASLFDGHVKRSQRQVRFQRALERKVGRQAMEIDFLRRCLQNVEEQRKLQALITRGSSTPTSKQK